MVCADREMLVFSIVFGNPSFDICGNWWVSEKPVTIDVCPLESLSSSGQDLRTECGDKLGCHRWMKTNNWTNWEETSNRWARTWGTGSKCVHRSLNSNPCSDPPPVRVCLMAASLPEATECLGGGAGGLAVAAEHEVTARKIYIYRFLFSYFFITCRMRHSRGWCARGRWGQWLRLSCSCSEPRAPGDPWWRADHWPPHPLEAGHRSVGSWNTGHSRACHSGPESSIALALGIRWCSEGFSLMLQFLASFPDQDWNNDDDEWM